MGRNPIVTGLLAAYRWCFCRRSLYRFNGLLHGLALRGVGVLNYEDDRVSGQDAFLRQLVRHVKNIVVIDVGAHRGDYSSRVAQLAVDATIFAFEPHPASFAQLRDEAGRYRYTALNLACGEAPGRASLFDYPAHEGGSQHASLYREVFEKVHGRESTSSEVEVVTLDGFIRSTGLREVHLLKIDAEGYELRVLQGARESISHGLVDIIQFEFNEMNVISRVFFRDFYEILPNYLFYRMLPDGLAAMGPYRPAACEVFAYQNIIAIRRDYPRRRALVHG